MIDVLAALALAGGTSPPAQETRIEPLRIIEETVRYPIQGDSIREIHRQLRDHGPWPAGSGHGRTRSEFEMRLDLDRDKDECSIRGLSLTLQLIVTLPQWQPGPAASHDVRTQWNDSLARLVRHEEGHRQHAVDVANELHRSLSGLPSQGECARIQRKADDLLRRAVSKLRLRGMLYDQRTDHGAVDPPGSR